MRFLTYFVVILKERKSKSEKERKKDRKVRFLTFFVVIFKERKRSKKERKKEKRKEKKERTNQMICGLPHRKRKEKKADKLSGKQVWRHNGTVSSVFEFVCSAMYLLKLHRQQQERERKREYQFINDTDNLIFQIILSLLHESFVFNYNKILNTFHLLIYSF